MPKRKLYNRLENLFNDLEKESSQVTTSIKDTLPGWTWVCDSKGNFLNCSPEVARHLGIEAGDFLGQPLMTFKLTPASIHKLEIILSEQHFPAEVSVDYFTEAPRRPVPVMLHIFQTAAVNGDQSGLYGFSQVLEQTVDREPSNGTERISTPGTTTQIEQSPIPAPTWPVIKSHKKKTFGYLSDPEQIKPSEKHLTTSGRESLEKLTPVVKNATEQDPAVLAVSLPMKEDETSLLLEILDETSGRLWSEDEQKLVEQVADQLTLALENAQLFQQTQARADEFRILREISLELAQEQHEIGTLLDVITKRSMDLLDSDGGGVWLWREELQELELVITYQVEGRSYAGKRMAPGQGLSGRAFSERRLQVVENYLAWDGQSIGFSDAPFYAAMAVPLIWQNQVFGTLVLTRSQPDNPYESNEQHLAELLGGQAAAVIQNARLFEQTQKARDVLEIRERYQKHVAQSVAAMTEQGTQALPQVLKIIGEAAGASRAYYFESYRAGYWTYWRLREEWVDSGVEPYHENPLVQRLPIEEYPYWSEQLLANGKISTPVNALPPQERKFFEAFGVRSLVQISVPGKIDFPGCIGLEDLNTERVWGEDEIAGLETTASALANTIAREDLFKQVQINLDETERLYKASAELNLAGDYEDILSVLRSYSIFGHSSVSNISISLFDRAWESSEKPEWFFPLINWTMESQKELPASRYSVDAWSPSELLLNAEQPTLIDEPQSDTRLNETARSVFVQRLKAKQILFTPLNIAGRWIGHCTTVFQDRLEIGDVELRRLMSLIRQATVAIENIRLLNETRQRNEELNALNKIIAAASRSLDMNEMLSEVLAQVLNTIDFEAGLISVVDPDDEKLSLVVHQGLPEEIIHRLNTKGFDGTLCNLVYDRREAVVLNDLTLESPLEASGLVAQGFHSYLGVPLESKGKVLGTICTFSLVPRSSNPQGISLMEAVGKQIGVAIENAGLFEQTHQALSEMDGMYSASADLNEAKTYEEILTVLRDHTIFSHADKLLGLVAFDRPWTENQQPDEIITLARWTTLSNVDLPDRYTLRDFPAASLLSPTAPTAVEDIVLDDRLDENTRTIYTHIFQAKSALVVPLVVGETWIGFINSVFGEKTQFDQKEIRRLMSLSGQAAVALQNLKNLELAQKRAQEAQKRSEELSVVNRVVSSVGSSLNLQASLDIVAVELGKALSVQVGIALLNYDRQSLRIVASYTPIEDSPDVIGIELPLEGNPSSQHVIKTRQTLVIEDPLSSPLTEPIHHLLAMRGIEKLMIIPILAGNQVIGTVGFDILEKNRSFSAEEIRLAETVVLQASTAIQNARLFEQTELALAESETLYNASAELNAAHTYDDILNILMKYTKLHEMDERILLRIFDRPKTGSQIPEWSITLAQWNKHPGFEQAAVRTPLKDFPALISFIESDIPSRIADISTDARLDEVSKKYLLNDETSKGVLFIPMIVAGNRIGYVEGRFNTRFELNTYEIRRMMSLANQAAVTLQNIHLLEESRQRANQLQTAAEIARDTSSTLALDTLLNRTVNLLCERFGYYHASIFLIDETRLNAVVRASTGEAGEEMKQKDHQLAVGSRSVIGYVTGSGEALVVNDVLQSPIHRPNPLLPETRAELGIPLKIGEHIIGALDVQSSHLNGFTPDDITVLQVLADQIAVAVDNARSYEVSQKAVEEMREVDRLKSQFLANMSHELRTPLNSIIGFSRVILKGIDGPINETQQQDLTAIYSSGQHLLGLINDVLDLSKIEAGKMELAFEDNVNVTDLVHSVMSTAAGLVKDKPIELHRDIAHDLPVVRADPMKIRQVLLNLISNSAKFTEQGSITVSAWEQLSPSQEPELVIAVADTGSGIAEEDQSKLFQPFSQVDGSLTRKTGGTGLGLSICRHLVDMHGGRIWLKSEVDVGTKFFFSIPIFKPKPDHFEETGEKIVLAIDDERQIITLYERYLSGHGYQVIALTDPSRAVERAIELQPCAITLDVMMPERNGWQVLEELKTNPETKHIPVIICSIVEDQEKGFSLGATDYLLKPILEDDLAMAVNNLKLEGDAHQILVVDDDPDVLGLIEKAFQDEEHYHLNTVDNGHDALTLLRINRPDALILDLFMPDLDGFTLLETIRSEPFLRDIPVIIYTAGELDSHQQQHLSQFAEKMLQKGSVHGEELLENIRSALNRYHYKD